MERTYINEAQKAIGGTVKVQGFIENLRNSKYMAFIVLKDITGKLQITVEKADHPELVDTIDQLTPDSVITVTGKVPKPPSVITYGISNTEREPEIARIMFSTTIVRMDGRMIYRKRCHAFAPSMAAASYCVLSTLAIAPINNTMFCPMYRQMEDATSTQLLMRVSLSQNGSISSGIPSKPRMESRTKPWV